MTEAEKELLSALAGMCYQYLGGEYLDHQCMGAGEDAVELLERYGLIKPAGRGGEWTQAGLALLDE